MIFQLTNQLPFSAGLSFKVSKKSVPDLKHSQQTTLIVEVDTKVRQVQKTSSELQRTCEDQRNKILCLESDNTVLRSEVAALQTQHEGSVSESSKREELLKQQVCCFSSAFWWDGLANVFVF